MADKPTTYAAARAEVDDNLATAAQPAAGPAPGPGPESAAPKQAAAPEPIEHDDGSVTVFVDGERYDLEPTPRAARIILRTFGGRLSQDVIDRLRRAELDTLVTVIDAGTGGEMKPAEQDALWDVLWRVDTPALTKITMGCIRFVAVIRNGGRPLPKDEPAKKGRKASKEKPVSGNA